MMKLTLGAKAQGKTMSVWPLGLSLMVGWLVLATTPVMAQYSNDYPLSVAMDVDSLVDGDTIALTFDYGTVSEPVASTTSITFHYPCDGFQINTSKSDITASAGSSWFVDNDVEWTISQSYNARDNVLSVTITRVGSGVGGYGEVMTLGGIVITIIVIEDWRLSAPEVAAPWAFESYPNPLRDRLYLTSEAAAFRTARIMDLSGRVISQWTGEQQKVAMDLGQVPAGFYTLEVWDGARRATRRLQVLPGQ
jgi:hypothetical protein